MLELAFLGSGPDMIIVMIVALIIFGPNRLPEVGRQVGQFLRDSRKMLASFTEAVNEVQNEVQAHVRDQSPIPPVPGEIVRGSSTVRGSQPVPQLTVSESAPAATPDAQREEKSETPKA